jgi:hypothetical protein
MRIDNIIKDPKPTIVKSKPLNENKFDDFVTYDKWT